MCWCIVDDHHHHQSSLYMCCCGKSNIKTLRPKATTSDLASCQVTTKTHRQTGRFTWSLLYLFSTCIIYVCVFGRVFSLLILWTFLFIQYLVLFNTQSLLASRFLWAVILRCFLKWHFEEGLGNVCVRNSLLNVRVRRFLREKQSCCRNRNNIIWKIMACNSQVDLRKIH